MNNDSICKKKEQKKDCRPLKRCKLLLHFWYFIYNCYFYIQCFLQFHYLFVYLFVPIVSCNCSSRATITFVLPYGGNSTQDNDHQTFETLITRTTGTFNDFFRASLLALLGFLTLKQTACASDAWGSAPCLPAPWLPHPEASMTSNLCSVQALKASIIQTSFLPFQYCWVLMYLFMHYFHFPIYLMCIYLFMYLSIYLFIYLVDYSLCYRILNCRWPFKMLLFNENLYMHDSAVEGFYSFSRGTVCSV